MSMSTHQLTLQVSCEGKSSSHDLTRDKGGIRRPFFIFLIASVTSCDSQAVCVTYRKHTINNNKTRKGVAT